MKITLGDWRAINGAKWTVVFASETVACGHDGHGNHAMWRPNDGVTMSSAYMDNNLVRPWPEPVLRPWRWEEVPVGALLRTNGARLLIVGVDDRGLISFSSEGQASVDGLGEFTHSTDGGKTWRPCGVMEGGAK